MAADSSFFLGPRRGRWTPGDWAGLEQAVGAGILNETGWVELKGGLPPNRDGGVEIARDLASLALRSGLLVVGVAEASRGVAGEIKLVDLAASRDRIDQIARNGASPPIYVETREIPHPEDPARGVLLVGVPASGPHMVDDRYWGRGDTGKATLSDPEVREHLTRRQLQEADVIEQLRSLERATLRRDGEQRPMPRLFLRAVPAAGRRDALLELHQDDNGGNHLTDMLRQAARQRPNPREDSGLTRAYWWGRYARGRSFSSLDPTLVPGWGETTLRLEDNGTVELIHDGVGSEASRGWDGSDGLPTVHTGIILSAVHDVLSVVGQIADRYAAYPGHWIVAVRLDALEGCRDWVRTRGLGQPPAYTGQPDYEDVTSTTTGELIEQPWAVTSRLVARLVRALGAERTYLPYEPGSSAAALSV